MSNCLVGARVRLRFFDSAEAPSLTNRASRSCWLNIVSTIGFTLTHTFEVSIQQYIGAFYSAHEQMVDGETYEFAYHF